MKTLSYNDACIFLASVFRMNALWDCVRVNDKHNLAHTIIVYDKNSNRHTRRLTGRRVMIELNMKLGFWNINADIDGEDITDIRVEDFISFFDVDASLAENIDNIEFTNTVESKEVLCNIVDMFTMLDYDKDFIGKINERINKMQPVIKHNTNEVERIIAGLEA